MKTDTTAIDTPCFRYCADMGFSRKELVKGLPAAVLPYHVVDAGAKAIHITMGDQRVILTTGPDQFRAIASMRIPVLAVSLEFYHFNQDQYDQFMRRFKKYLHKGGG